MGRTPAYYGLLLPRMRATQVLAANRDRSAAWWRGDSVAMRATSPSARYVASRHLLLYHPLPSNLLWEISWSPPRFLDPPCDWSLPTRSVFPGVMSSVWSMSVAGAALIVCVATICYD